MNGLAKLRVGITKYLNSKSLVQVCKVQDTKRKRKKGLNNDSRLREIAKDEIVIEFDTPSRERALSCMNHVLRRLANNGYRYVVYDHNGRSPHIHIYDISALESLDMLMVLEYKREFIKKYSPFEETDIGLNTSTSHLVAMEFRPHFKHNVVKDIITYYSCEISNSVEISLLEKAKRNVDRILKNRRERTFNPNQDDSWFIRFAIDNTLPAGSWHDKVAKTIAIIIVNQNLNITDVLKNFSRKDAQHITGWLSWSYNDKYFNPLEIMSYMDDVGLDFSTVRNRYMSGIEFKKNSGTYD